MRILQEEEVFSRRLRGRDAKDGLSRTYGNQAVILQDWDRLEESMTLHKKQEALCVELGEPDKAAKRKELTPGKVVWRPAETHTVTNVGDREVRLVEI